MFGQKNGCRSGTTRRGWMIGSIVAAAGMAMAVPAQAQSQVYRGGDVDEHYEWEPDEGVHQEEWYDPSDWWDDDFDGRRLDYESDWYEEEWDAAWGYDDEYDYYDDDYGEDYIGRDDYYYEQMGYGDHGEWSDEDWGVYTGYGEQWDDDAWYVGDDVNDSEFNGYNEWQSDYEDWYDEDGWYDDEDEWYEDNSDWFGDYETWYDEREPQLEREMEDNRSIVQPRDTQRRQADVWERSRDRQRMQQDRRASGQDRQRMQAWENTEPPRVMVQGEVDGFRRVRLDGERESHTVTRVRLDNGSRVLVNLGPRASLSRLDIESGDRISIMGRLGRIDEQNVVLAERVRSGDRVYGMNNWRHSDKVREQNDTARRQASRSSDRQDRDMRSRDWQEAQRRTGAEPDWFVNDRRRHGMPLPSNLREGDDFDRERASRTDRRDRTNRDRGDWTARDRGSRDRGEQGYAWTRGEPMRQRGMDSRQGMDLRQGMDSRQGQRMHPDARRVRGILANWPEQSRKSAEAMLKKYGKPAAISKEMLVWTNTGPFVRTEVYGHQVQHNFPTPHKDVLQQYVNFKVPPDKMDDIAKFDGSVVVYLTDGLMAARCHKEAMNILTLNIAADIAEGRKTVKEAREAFAKHAEAHMNGERPRITQELTFDTKSRNTDRANRPGEEYSRGQD